MLFASFLSNETGNILDLSMSTRTGSRSSSIDSQVSSLNRNDDSCQPASTSSTNGTDDSSSNTDSGIKSTRITATRAKSKVPMKKSQVISCSDPGEASFDFEKYKGIISKWNIGDGKGNLVRCEICMKYPDLVKRYRSNRKMPPITTSDGTGNRTIVLNEHLESRYHLASMEKYKNDKLKATGKAGPTEIVRMISASNVQKANRMSRYFMSVYTDAKALTASAYSWPGRIFTSEYGREYHINQPDQNDDALQKLNLQYMSPVAYADFLEAIVHVEKNVIVHKLESCLAISLRVDGSIDRTSIDKIYVLGKIVNAEGKIETLFLGVDQQEERGAKGLYATIEKIMNKHESNMWDKLLRKMSSFVTDGASINVGEHKGLWRLIDNAALAAGAEQPITKIWCAAHRSDLVVRDLGKFVSEVPAAIKKCSSISSFIRRSAVRLVQLKKIAREKHLPLRMLPTYHEVRWTEFSLQLLSSILTSWRGLVYFFQQLIDDNDEHSAEAFGYMSFLTDFDNFQLLCFLGDVFQILSKFQKQLQSDTLNIISLDGFVKEFKHSLNNLNDFKLLGGWEESFVTYCKENDYKKYYVDDIEVKKSCRRMPCTRNFAFVREEILKKMDEFTTIRFNGPTDVECDTMMPFFKFENNNQVHVRNVHEIMASDVDISSLYIQFERICNNTELKNMALPKLLQHLVKVDNTDSFTEMVLVLARLIAATPHSADVERSISANNLLKTALRSSIKIHTENNFLFIHFNLPPLINWDPQNAVNYWFTAKERRVHNLTVENENRQTKKRPFFKGVFPQARECDEVINADFHEIEEPTTKRRCF